MVCYCLVDVNGGIGCNVILCFIDQFGAMFVCLDLYFLPLSQKKKTKKKQDVVL